MIIKGKARDRFLSQSKIYSTAPPPRRITTTTEIWDISVKGMSYKGSDIFLCAKGAAFFYV